MAEAANLSVSITGDASGLISALGTAQSAIEQLNASAGKIMTDFAGKEAKINISAADNTAAGVESARARINSLTDKTVTISVRYNVSQMPKLAKGTREADEGLAVVNDERGKSDPRELIEHNGSLMMFSGSDVIVPLSRGDRVYTADETKAIMNGMGLPHYAGGKNNEFFEAKKADLNHYKKTNNMSPAEELAWWNELMEQFYYDSEAVKEIQEQVFSAQQKIWKEQKKESEDALSDYKKHSDAWIKYQVEVNDAGVDEQIEAYQRQLYNYNAMVSDMAASTLYTADEMKDIWNDFYEYKSGVDLKIGKLEKEKNHAVYEKWQSDAKNWKMIRDTYDDWDEVGDSPVQFYQRSIERIQQMYDSGHVGWQEYRDDTMNAVLNLYTAKMDQVDELLLKQKQYIGSTKQKYADEESELESQWKSEDRAVSKAEISHQLGIYSGAVTERGRNRYKELQEEMKKIKREEEMLALQKEHSEKLALLENSYDTVESNKKHLLSVIEQSGLNIEGIVSSVNYDIQGMQSIITSLFNQTIRAIRSISIPSNSYSDNRNISINASTSDIVDALKNRVGLTIAHGSYY